MTHTT